MTTTRNEDTLPVTQVREEEMVARLCPHCQTKSNFRRPNPVSAEFTPPKNAQEEIALDFCENCHAVTFFRTPKGGGEPVIDQYPKTVEKAPSELPENIYGSLWVEIADEDPVGSRVFPPFQGAAGGPSGGPIMTLKGQEIDLFVMPTGVRPGAILEVGDRFVFAGQVGPPLASKVTVKVTSPGGVLRTFSGQANPIGYFSDPAGDFVVDEPGVWTVEVQVVHDGLTSAGPVEPPYPTGGVLGSADGRFQVYVVPMEATQLDFGLSAFGIYALPGSMRMLFFPRIPDGWTDVTGVYTITMPGFILEEGSLTLQGGVFELVYDPVRLSQEFLNIDLASRHGFGAGLADEVFISVMLTGTDASGQRVNAAKLLTLVGEDIYDLN